MNPLKSKIKFASSSQKTAKCPPIAFRTIVKCRNNSNEPYPSEVKSIQKSVSASRISTLNNSMSDFQTNSYL